MSYIRSPQFHYKFPFKSNNGFQKKKSIPLAKVAAVARFKTFKDYGSLQWTLSWIQTGQMIKGSPDYNQTLYPFICNI